MRSYLALVSGVAAIAGIAASVGIAPAQEPQLAPEGRGLLPPPAEIPAAPQGPLPPQIFKPDPSGGFSRTIFETDENPDFKLIIRDFSFPPDKQPHIVTLPSGAFVHFLGESGDVKIAKAPLAIRMGARTPVAAGAPIEVTNNSERAVVVRTLIVEAK